MSKRCKRKGASPPQPFVLSLSLDSNCDVISRSKHDYPSVAPSKN